MTVSTFFPDGDVESTSVDGNASRLTDAIWDTIRAGAGEESVDDAAVIELHIQKATGSNWNEIRRTFFLFDTSSLPDTDEVDSGTMEFVSSSSNDSIGSQTLSLIDTTPASSTAIADADYGQAGTTKQADDITEVSIVADSSTYNPFTLNSIGRASISLTSITKFGIRATADSDDAEPTANDAESFQIIILAAEEIVAGDKRPKLVITHNLAGILIVSLAAMHHAQPIQIPTGMRPY